MLRRIAAITLLLGTLVACGTVTDALNVTNLFPADGATDVPVDAVVEATFDREIDEASVAGAFTLGSASGLVDGTVAYDAASLTATFTPDTELAYDTTYTATVSGSVSAADGGSLDGEASWSFTTEAAPTEPDVTDVTVAPSTATLVVGGTQQLTATVTAVGGADESVTWSSDNESAATVDSDGLVTAVAAGEATITATSVVDDTVSGSAAITVEVAEDVTDVTVSPDTAILSVDGTSPVQLTATVTAVGGADESVTWSSDNESAATVDSDGLVTAVAPGAATITATSDFDGSVTGSSDITVAEPLTGNDYLLNIDAGDAIDPVLTPDLSGGAAPFTFTEIGTYEADPTLPILGLPPGTTLDPDTGEISGTPIEAGFWRAVIEVSDASGQTIEVLSEIDVSLVLVFAQETYAYTDGVTGEVVPAADIEVLGDTGTLAFSMALVSSAPVGDGDPATFSIDPVTGAIVRDTATTTETTWVYDVTVFDDGTGEEATFQVTFEEEGPV